MSDNNNNNDQPDPFDSHKQALGVLDQIVWEGKQQDVDFTFYVFRRKRSGGLGPIRGHQQALDSLAEAAEVVKNQPRNEFCCIALVPTGQVGVERWEDDLYDRISDVMFDARAQLDAFDRAVVPVDTPKGRAITALVG